MSSIELEQKAQEAIRRVLENIPQSRVEIVMATPPGKWDFTVLVETPRWTTNLACEVRSRAWPNELHAVGHRLKQLAPSGASNGQVPVLIAPYVSKQTASLCQEIGLSWVDFAGNCELSVGAAYIKIQGEHNPFRQGRGTASLYSPKSASVIQALLVDFPRSWTIEELAQTARVSLGQVSSVKKILERNNWIRATYGKIDLVEPEKLLADWSQNYTPKRNTLRFFTLDSPHELETKISNTLSEYAFTEFSAAERYASYTRHQKVAFYVPRWEDEWGRALGLKRGDSASNVTVYEQIEPLLFAETQANGRCVSPIQTYLDLKVLTGRGQDAASHLYETLIQPRWP